MIQKIAYLFNYKRTPEPKASSSYNKNITLKSDKYEDIHSTSEKIKTKINRTDHIKKDPLIGLISNLRKIIEPKIKPYLKIDSGIYPYDLRNTSNIVIDALIYVSLKRTKNIYNYDLATDPVLSNILFQDKCSKLMRKIYCNQITFQNVIDTTISELNLKPINQDNLENILNHSDLKDNPNVRLALRMYSLRGHFNWVTHSDSEFESFLFNKTKDSLPDYSDINCWEAVFYGLMKSDLISRELLKKLYEKDISNTENNLTRWFDFENSLPISKSIPNNVDWKENFSKEPYFIMMESGNYDTNRGLKHDMLSFPYSQKQLLKMLITEKFDESPTKPKLYSHWTNWTGSSLGSVRKLDFENTLAKSRIDTRVTPLKTLIKNSRDMM